MTLPEEKHKIIAKTLAGLEEILATELKELGAEDVRALRRGVSCIGNMELVYRLNYLSRLALRFLVMISEDNCRNTDEFYNTVKEIPWWNYLDKRGKLAVDASIFNNSFFKNSHFAELRAKDAIVDAFRDKFGRRPDVDTAHPDLRINVHMSGTQCTISLDSSGNALNQRGYRKKNVEAPLNEVLAAGLIRLSGWDGKTSFIDPMCGSGTLLIEAAMMANQIPAGYYRKDFGFFHWLNFDKKLWKEIVETQNSRISESDISIKGGDISRNNLDAAEFNIKEAKLHRDIELVCCDFSEFRPPEPPGFLISNPPYGERLSLKDKGDMYRKFGDFLKNSCSGYHAWLISSDMESLKTIGLKAFRKYQLFNGALECRFNGYELYRGSRRENACSE